MTDFITSPQGRRLAFNQCSGSGPGIVFLGGFRSDMSGTKALFLEDRARARGRSFLRFDYSGHGESGGAFEEGCIGDWAADAAAALALTKGPQVLVGSSMGGWIALLLARLFPQRIAGLVTIAAAPDFTDEIYEELSEAEREALAETGRIERPSEYSDEPYVFTRRLIEDGRRNRIFDRPLRLPMPVRFLQGSADADVAPTVALHLFNHTDGPDIRLTLVKDADHRFSTPACLALIWAAVEDVAPV